MRDFFKPEQFTGDCGFNFSIDKAKDIAEIANCILNAEIEKWPVVYGSLPGTGNWGLKLDKKDDTHKARLAFIEPIKKEPCKHEPKEILWSQERPYRHFECKHCGVELVAEWKPK